MSQVHVGLWILQIALEICSSDKPVKCTSESINALIFDTQAWANEVVGSNTACSPDTPFIYSTFLTEKNCREILRVFFEGVICGIQLIPSSWARLPTWDFVVLPSLLIGIGLRPGNGYRFSCAKLCELVPLLFKNCLYSAISSDEQIYVRRLWSSSWVLADFHPLVCFFSQTVLLNRTVAEKKRLSKCLCVLLTCPT